MANRLKRCKNKECAIYFEPPKESPDIRHCSPACAQAILEKHWAKVRKKQEMAQKRSQRAEKKVNAKRKREYKQNDIKTRREAAVREFNRFVRLRDYDKCCISCGSAAGSFKLTAGHFITAGSCTALRFDEDNVYGQCWYNCNKNKSGNITGYRLGLLERFGEAKGKEILEKLEGPQPIINITVDFYKQIEDKYKAKCKELQQIRG